MHTALAHVLQERVACLEDALVQIEQHTDAETGLHNLRARLPNLLEVIERDPGITPADDLLSAAAAFGQGHNPARARFLRQAFQRFRERLASARLNERGRKMGIE